MKHQLPLAILLSTILITPSINAHVQIQQQGRYKIITSDGKPNHSTGDFPNRHNPNRISQQKYRFKVPLSPKFYPNAKSSRGYLFGVALNGIPFDPGTAEFWPQDRRWNYEALSGHLNLGLDHNNAHVQPSGAYHYHGIPMGLLQGNRPQLIGYAADGFGIYNQYGYSDPNDANSPIKELKSSYGLKRGDRSSIGGPTGSFDGRFVQDWRYYPGSGDLDQCNGRVGVTPESSQPTYYYVLTDAFPFVPRCFKGEPDASFRKQHHGGPRNRQRPGGQQRPGRY